MPRTRRWIWIAVLLLAAYAAYWLYRFAVSRLGPIAPLLYGAVAALLALVAIGWTCHRYGDVLLRWAEEGFTWLWARVSHTRPIRALRTHERLWHVLVARVDPRATTGLGLSVAALAAAGALWAFLGILFEVVGGTTVTSVDHRVVNLFAQLRTPRLDRVMLTFSYIGSVRSVVVLAAAAVLVALPLRRWRDAVLVPATLLAASAFSSGVKLLVHRPRPPRYLARVIETSFSFPSGHSTTAVAFFGTLAVLLMLAVRGTGARVLLAAAAVLLAFFIGLSRIYLGVHYPSDVLGGWVGGGLWVAIVLAISRIWRPRPREVHRAGWVRPAAAAAVVVAAPTYLYLSRPVIPAPPTATAPPPQSIAPGRVEPTLVHELPHYTESLLGHRQEPVNLVFVASRPELEQSFRLAGWTRAAPLSWASLTRAVGATLGARPDPAGPVTPDFLRERPEDLAFSLPVGHTFAKRHHIRIWDSRYRTADGRVLWLATASYDAGFALAMGTLLPVHKIAPDIDDERDFIVRDLSRTGAVTRADTLALVPPQMGTNAFGSPFFTYGHAVLLRLGRPGGMHPGNGIETSGTSAL